VKPPPTLTSLEEISRPALVAMAVATGLVLLDGLAGPTVVLVGLLAIPPVIAAMSASTAETGIVGGFCALMAIFSGLWNQNIDSAEYVVEVLTVLAGGIAGLWVASLRENLNREQAAAELFVELGERMEAALDQHERADHLADLAVPALGDVAMIDMVTPEGTIERMASQSGDSEVAELFDKMRAKAPIALDGPHPVAEVIRTGEMLELDQLSDERIDEITTRENERELLRRHRFQYCLLLPLKARGSVLGAMTLWIMRPSNAFDQTAQVTAQRLAQRAALALDNARLHEQQAHIAGVLQHSLLPRSLPEIPGFEIASRFQAAGEAYEVGGDFYDAFRTGSRSWSIVIGDVCGKGPEAAALTSLARYTIRTASNPANSPSAVLRVLHESIGEERADLRFCTAALMRLDPPSNGRGAAQLTLALGGHPPALTLRRDGRVRMVGEPGTLLGAISDPSVVDVGARLSPGDSLVLYTDGMLETRNRKSADDPKWLGGQLAKLAGKRPEEIAERLTAAAIRRQGGEPRDDIAVVVLRRRGKA
jgi:serine phosphatase RsbU (regulator of sigma subunit)